MPTYILTRKKKTLQYKLSVCICTINVSHILLKIKLPTEKFIGIKPIISNKDKNDLTFEAIMELGFIF